MPDVYFGPVDRKPKNWRKGPDIGPDDDELLATTPADVVALLGFDPTEKPRKS